MTFQEAVQLCQKGVARVRCPDGVSVINASIGQNGKPFVWNSNHYLAHNADHYIKNRTDWEPMLPKDAITRLGEVAS